MTHDERLRRVAADHYNSAKRRGWINASADPHITKEDYMERFIEQHSHVDIDALEEAADVARPSNMPTLYERECDLPRLSFRR